jgi:uncharacterized protein (DUF362 family)
VAAGGGYALGHLLRREGHEDVFIAKAADYGVELTSLIKSGLKELGLSATDIKGKRILLKPNNVEPRQGQVHICTHPLVVEAAAEAFRSLGAAKVIVAEGSGHCTDFYRTLDESGMASVLAEARLPFVDLNRDDIFQLPNQGQLTELKTLCFPATLKQVDWIVSMPKLKTHHWAGVTMSMKNLFGVMPGIVYGWPKNVLHHAGVIRSILDINATLKPHFAIVDGIVGMEGDGPIMGTPKAAGVLVMGRNLPAVDATCARIMGVDPQKVQYLKAASAWLGSIGKAYITQRGEAISSVQTNFALIPAIPAHRRLLSKG